MNCTSFCRICIPAAKFRRPPWKLRLSLLKSSGCGSMWVCNQKVLPESSYEITSRNFSANVQDPPSKLENVVYIGPLKTNIIHAKFFSFSSSAVGFCMQPYFVANAAELHPVAVIIAGTLLGFFTYLTPYLLHLVAKRYVTQLSYSVGTKTFTCTTLNFFTIPKKISFQAADVHVPDVPGLFTTFKVKGKPLFIDPKQFTDINVYANLMGYDKPIDFHAFSCGGKETSIVRPSHDASFSRLRPDYKIKKGTPAKSAYQRANDFATYQSIAQYDMRQIATHCRGLFGGISTLAQC